MITVGLPVYNQTDILKLALLGLSRQKNAGKWELIICSEDDVSMVIGKYTKSLKKAGCRKIAFNKLDKWIPLPQKWRKIGRMMHSRSVGMILQAADCYPHKNRIRQSRNAMVNGYDWYQEEKGYFYDFNTEKMVLLSGAFGKKNPTRLNMCIASRHARKFPLSSKLKGIDKWMLGTIKKPKIYSFKGLPLGVDTHGKNTISHKRGRLIENYIRPFYKTDRKIEEIVDLKKIL